MRVRTSTQRHKNQDHEASYIIQLGHDEVCYIVQLGHDEFCYIVQLDHDEVCYIVQLGQANQKSSFPWALVYAWLQMFSVLD